MFNKKDEDEKGCNVLSELQYTIVKSRIKDLKEDTEKELKGFKDAYREALTEIRETINDILKEISPRYKIEKVETFDGTSWRVSEVSPPTLGLNNLIRWNSMEGAYLSFASTGDASWIAPTSIEHKPDPDRIPQDFDTYEKAKKFVEYLCNRADNESTFYDKNGNQMTEGIQDV